MLAFFSRHLLLSLCTLTVLLAGSLPAMAAARPVNIVLILSDDMGWGDVRFAGSRVKIPNIDQLRADGVLLKRFYVCPVCSPTRTALMTGRSPLRYGITQPLGGRSGVPTGERFLPSVLRGSGYQTLMVGKWHLGAGGKAYAPQSRGFDHFYGFLGGAIDYYAHTRSRGQIDWQRNGKTIREEGYSTDLFAKEACSLLKGRNKSKPLFLYLSFNAPHSPFQAPSSVAQKYRRMGLQGSSALRAASIESMDQAIGRVLSTLKSEGMEKNTIVMFFCDNGAGRRHQPNNQKQRGGKGTVYEGGIQVPAVIRWPDVLKGGSTSHQLMSAHDLLPTLAGAAGAPLNMKKTLDGENMWPSIQKGNLVSGREVVIASSNAIALITDSWKLIRTGEKVELFHLKQDPGELKDLSKERIDLVKKLDSTLASYQVLYSLP